MSLLLVNPAGSIPKSPLAGGDIKAMGIADVVNMDVAELDHPKMFTKLFKSILNYRLKEIDFSRVSTCTCACVINSKWRLCLNKWLSKCQIC